MDNHAAMEVDGERSPNSPKSYHQRAKSKVHKGKSTCLIDPKNLYRMPWEISTRNFQPNGPINCLMP